MGAQMIGDKLYRAIDVWKRDTDKYAIRFRCFEVIGENKFCTLNCDYFPYPVKNEHVENIDDQTLFIELFIESSPEERTEMYSSLEESIRMFEKEFEEDIAEMKRKGMNT